VGRYKNRLDTVAALHERPLRLEAIQRPAAVWHHILAVRPGLSCLLDTFTDHHSLTAAGRTPAVISVLLPAAVAGGPRTGVGVALEIAVAVGRGLRVGLGGGGAAVGVSVGVEVGVGVRPSTVKAQTLLSSPMECGFAATEGLRFPTPARNGSAARQWIQSGKVCSSKTGRLQPSGANG